MKLIHLARRIAAVAVIFNSVNLQAQMISGGYNNAPVPKEMKASAITGGSYSGDVNLFNGAYNSGYSLGSVKTPGGLSFNLMLNYGSTATVGDNPVVCSGIPYGEGWNLGIPTLTVQAEPYEKMSECTMQSSGGVNSVRDDNNVQEFSREEISKEGKLFWYSPTINIPGVISERFVFKHFDMDNHDAVFVPARFERYVEARLKGNNTWVVILDDGTQYHFTFPVINYRTPSNQRFDVNAISDGSSNSDDLHISPAIIANLVLPKAEVTTWYCNVISNLNHAKGQNIIFDYETFGKFSYFNEIDQQSFLASKINEITGWQTFSGNGTGGHTVNNYTGEDELTPLFGQFVYYKDILLKSVTAVTDINISAEKIVLNYSTVVDYDYQTATDPGTRNDDNSKLIPYEQTSNYLAFNESGVEPKDEMYNAKTVYSLPEDERNWTRFYHYMAPEVVSHLAGAYKNPIGYGVFNPYRFDDNGDIKSYIKKVDNSLTFNHGYLQSPKIGDNLNFPPGDLYEIRTEIDDNFNLSYKRWANFDINIFTGKTDMDIQTGNASTTGLSFFEFDTNEDDYTGINVFSTFNNGIKWCMNGDGSNEEMKSYNFFVMPNLPSDFNGFHISVGAANSDNLFTSDPSGDVGGMDLGATSSTTPSKYNAFKSYANFATGSGDQRWEDANISGSTDIIEPCDRAPNFFGVGLPWYMMSDWMFMVDNNPSDYTGNSPSTRDNWTNNGYSGTGGNYCFWHSTSPATIENIPTRLDENIELINVELRRYSRNAYMLTSVEKFVTNGEIGKPLYFAPNTNPGLKKISRTEMDYSVSLDDMWKNVRPGFSGTGISNPNDITGFKRNVFLLSEIRQVPVDPTKNNASFSFNINTVPKTVFEYEKKDMTTTNFGIVRGSSITNFSGRLPFSTRAVYLMTKATNEIGGITEIEYGDNMLGIEKYRIGYTAQAYYSHHSWNGTAPELIMNDPHVVQVYCTVKKKKVTTDAASPREWEYEFLPGISNANIAGKRELETISTWDAGTICGSYDIMGEHLEPHVLDYDFGFKESVVLEPEITPSAGRNYSIYYHHDDYKKFGKLYKTEKFDAAFRMLSETNITYAASDAYIRPTSTDNIVQVEDGTIASYIYNDPASTDKDRIRIGTSDEIEFAENAFDELFSDRYLGSYFIKKESESTKTYQDVLATTLPNSFTSVSTSGDNAYNTSNTIYSSNSTAIASEDASISYIENIKEYSYFDAYRDGDNLTNFGTSTTEGYENLIPGFASNDFMLEGEASWQIFSVKEYSPQLPGESKTTEFYYYFDIAGLYQIYHPGYYEDLETEFKELYYLHKKNVRNAPFEKRVITQKPGGDAKIESEYYIYSARYTSGEVYADQNWTYSTSHFDSSPCPDPPEPPDPPVTDPCAYYKDELSGCVRWTGTPPNPIPPNMHYCNGSWYWCSEISMTGRAASTESLEYQHFGDMFEFEFDTLDTATNTIAMREIYIPLERRALLKEIHRQVTEVSNADYATSDVLHKTSVPLMRFKYVTVPGSSDLIAKAVMPYEDLKETEILMYNPHGQVKKIADAKGLITYYRYDGHQSIRYIDDGECITEFMESKVCHNVAVPVSVTVGYGLDDALTTNYEYWPDYSVKKIIQPNGEYVQYEYDEYGRLKNTIDNGNLVTQNKYSHWQNTVTDFEDKAEENYVETKTLVNEGSNAGTISRAYVDPMGRSYNELSYTSTDVFGTGNPTSIVYGGENVYDEWDRLQKKYAPFVYTGTAAPAVPRFNTVAGINTYFKHTGYEDNFFSRPLNLYQNGNYSSGPYTETQYGFAGGLRFSKETGLNQAMHELIMPSATGTYVYNKTLITDEDGKKTVTYTNAMGQKVAVMQQINATTGALTLYVYDSRGNLVKTLNPERQETNYYYNQLGRLWKKETVDQQDGTGTLIPSYYIYDERGSVVLEHDAICNRYYEYDMFGRKTLQARISDFPDYCGGSTDPLFTERNSNRWLYTWACDENNDLTFSQVFLLPQPEKKWFYDYNHDPSSLEDHPAIQRYLSFSRTNLKGRLSHSISFTEEKDPLPHTYYEIPVLYTFYSYNNDGNLKWEIQQFNPDGISIHNRGLPVRIDYPDYNLQGSLRTKNIDVNCEGILDFQTHYVYDLRNRLTEVYANHNNAKASGNKVATYTYDDATGMVTNTSHIINNTDVLAAYDNVYDIRNRLTHINSDIYSEQLYYDGSNPSGNTNTTTSYNGNINALKHSYPFTAAKNAPPNFSNITQHTFEYDGINRLLLAQNTGTVVSADLSEGSESYTYDRIGNIFTLNRLEVGGTTPSTDSYSYLSATNRLTSAGTRDYTYDYNGNLLTDDTRLLYGIHYGRANLPLYLRKTTSGGFGTGELTTFMDYLYNNDDKRIFKRTVTTAGEGEEEGPMPAVNEFYLNDATGAMDGIWNMMATNWTWYINGRQLELKNFPAAADQQPYPNIDEVSEYEALNEISAAIASLLDGFRTSDSLGFTLPDTLYYCRLGDSTRCYVLYSLLSTIPGDTTYTILNKQALTDEDQLLTIFTSDTTSVQVSVAELRARQELLMPDGAPALADPFYTPYDYYSDVTLYLSNLTYYAYDHLGNTRVTYTPTGDFVGSDPEYDVMGAFDYYPYGKILREYINGEQEKFLTTHHQRDVETGLDYRGARFYDADVARFLSLDPWADKYVNWSAYNYVFSNPNSLIDPTGKGPWNMIAGLIGWYAKTKVEGKTASKEAASTMTNTKPINQKAQGKDIFYAGLKVEAGTQLFNEEINLGKLSGGVFLNSKDQMGVETKVKIGNENVATYEGGLRVYNDAKGETVTKVSEKTEINQFNTTGSGSEDLEVEFDTKYAEVKANISELCRTMEDVINSSIEYIKTSIDQNLNPQDYLNTTPPQ